jgi:hypothetical protein
MLLGHSATQHSRKNECCFNIKTLKDNDKSCETQPQSSKWNIVWNGEDSNSVVFRMAVPRFFDIEHNTSL